jgi:hemoglobin-like flavoprotein
MELAESVERVLRAPDVFGEFFYEEFFRRCPAAEPFFDGHDMKRQALVVTMTLQTIQQFHDGGYPAVDRYVEHLGVVHRRLQIPMEMYPHFRAAMLKVLARLLSDVWSSELRRSWEVALDKSVAAMIKGSERPESI